MQEVRPLTSQEVDRLESAWAGSIGHSEARSIIQRLIATVRDREREQDTERLDWLENETSRRDAADLFRDMVFDSVREAIDAARIAQGQEGK